MQRGYRRVVCSVLIIYRTKTSRKSTLVKYHRECKTLHKFYAQKEPYLDTTNEPATHPRTRRRSHRAIRPSGTLLRRLRQALVSNLIDPIRKSGRHPLDVKLVPICWPRIRGYQRVLFVCQRSEWYVRCNGISHISHIISRVIVFPQSRPHQKATL